MLQNIAGVNDSAPSINMQPPNADPPWLQFPAVWGRVHAPMLGTPVQEERLLQWLDDFMNLMQPHQSFPHVWAVSLLERIVNANGHARWVVFCYVSRDEAHVPEHAAMVWRHGELVRLEPGKFRYGEESASVLEAMVDTGSDYLVPLARK